MADKKAKEYIAEYNRLVEKQTNSRSLWQRTGDKMWPYVDKRNTGHYADA